MKLRHAIPAALVLALSGAAVAQQPQAGQKLTGFTAWSKLVGNTVTGKIDGKECYAVEVMGDVATFSSKSHGSYRLTILQGNAKKL